MGLLTIDTNVSILDLVDFGFVLDNYPDFIKEFKEEKGIGEEETYELSKQQQEELILQYFSGDTGMYENYWEGVVDYLQELLDKAGFVKGDPMLHMVGQIGWQGHGGSRRFIYDGTAQSFIRETFARHGSDFYAEVLTCECLTVTARVSCHDIPTGTTVKIQYAGTKEDKVAQLI